MIGVDKTSNFPNKRGTFSMPSSHTLDRVAVTFDDDHAVANAGLLLTASLAQHLELEALADDLVRLDGRPGAGNEGAKVMTLVHAIALGGDCIDDVDLLRSGSTAAVVAHRVMAPSTVGTFLRSFTFGHVRQLDRLLGDALGRAWAAGAGPGDAPMTIDLDSTIEEVHGYAKQGATFGHTRQRGYHPLVATRAETGEVLHCRQRTGKANTARGAIRFVDELVARVRRAGATGELTLRADSGFWSNKLIRACVRHKMRFSLTVRAFPKVKDAIAAIGDDAWVDIDYTLGGRAQLAETTLDGHRLIVRRTRLVGRQAELWPEWRHHGFITNREGDMVDLDGDHRAHAVVELAIRDLKEGSGWNHAPSGKFMANSAWLVIAALAHNLLRWTALIGGLASSTVVAKTIRRRYLTLPGRLTRSARRTTLHLPSRWPASRAFLAALARIRAVALC
ncbi:MAG: IS1380 family transposase [Acidimicrobiia bacterium]